MLAAISNQLKTGSITTILSRGGSAIAPPGLPYIVIWEDTPESGGDERIGETRIIINTHYPVGNWAELDSYVNRELQVLLDKVLLTATDTGRTFRLHKTKEIGTLVQGNDDKTISRERVFTTVKFY